MKSAPKPKKNKVAEDKVEVNDNLYDIETLQKVDFSDVERLDPVIREGWYLVKSIQLNA
jgi:hypothetical protein